MSAGASFGRIAAGGGSVFVAFSDMNANGQLTVMKSQGSSWAPVGNPGFTSAPVDGTDLALTVDGSGAPWVAYVSNDPNQGGSSVLTVGKVVGGSWATQGSAGFAQPSGAISTSVGNLGDISVGDIIESPSFTVYDGVPYVAFDDESRDGDPEPRAATVKYWDGAHWTLYAGYPNPCDIEDTVITSDPTSGKLYLTYQDCNGFMAVDVH